MFERFTKNIRTNRKDKSRASKGTSFGFFLRTNVLQAGEQSNRRTELAVTQVSEPRVFATQSKNYKGIALKIPAF
jgi:hypothetical protein